MKRVKNVPVTVEKVVEKVVENRTEVVEEDGGYATYLGKWVILLCANYIYYGKLTGVNGDVLELEGPSIVYQTGKWDCTLNADGTMKFQNAQRLPRKTCLISKSAVESVC
jgi:hypothetical protein